MKRKILILSICINMIAAVFVFLAFREKTNYPNKSEYVIMNVPKNGGEILVSGGDSTLKAISLRYPWSEKELKMNERMIANEINELNASGYELVSSHGDHYESNYVFKKK